MRLRTWLGCVLLAPAGCGQDAGGSWVEPAASPNTEAPGECATPGCGPASLRALTTASDTQGTSTTGESLEGSASGGSATDESSGESSSDGSGGASTGSPTAPRAPCEHWRAQLSEGFLGHEVSVLGNDFVAVAGQLDGLAALEVLDSNGVHQRTHLHDLWSDGDGETVVRSIAPIGSSRVVGVASRSLYEPGFVFMIDAESGELAWNHYVDAGFVGRVDGLSKFAARSPVKVSASHEGHLALLISAEFAGTLNIMIGLDPSSGLRTWSDHEYSYYSSNAALVANDSAGWFTSITTSAFGGGASHSSQRWWMDTGERVESPAGPSGGLVAGPSVVRSDGTLVGESHHNMSYNEFLRLDAYDPYGAPADTTVALAPNYASASGAAADTLNQAYFLVGHVSLGPQGVYRYNPDATIDLVFVVDDDLELHDIATTSGDDLILFGTDGTKRGEYVERYCVDAPTSPREP